VNIRALFVKVLRSYSKRKLERNFASNLQDYPLFYRNLIW